MIGTITVGSAPTAVAVSLTGANAGDVYVTNSGSGAGNTVSVIGPSNTVITTITVGPGPNGVAVSPTGTYAGDVYVTNSGSGTGTTVSVIGPGNTVIATITVGSNPLGVTISPTGAYAGDIYVVNSVNPGTVSVLQPGGPLTAPTFAQVATIDVGANPSGVAISPTGASAGDGYVTNVSSKSVSVIGPSNTVIATITAGVGFSPHGVAVSPTGTNAGDVYVTNSGDIPGTVSVIGPSNTVIATIAVGSTPYGVAVAP